MIRTTLNWLWDRPLVSGAVGLGAAIVMYAIPRKRKQGKPRGKSARRMGL